MKALVVVCRWPGVVAQTGSGCDCWRTSLCLQRWSLSLLWVGDPAGETTKWRSEIWFSHRWSYWRAAVGQKDEKNKQKGPHRSITGFLSTFLPSWRDLFFSFELCDVSFLFFFIWNAPVLVIVLLGVGEEVKRWWSGPQGCRAVMMRWRAAGNRGKVGGEGAPGGWTGEWHPRCLRNSVITVSWKTEPLRVRARMIQKNASYFRFSSRFNEDHQLMPVIEYRGQLDRTDVILAAFWSLSQCKHTPNLQK